jgi:hypothetical protein
MRHSISAERVWQQCRRQYFFSEVMANSNAHDKRRNQAQFLKKIDSIDEWIGKIVHKAIEDYVVPTLQENRWPTEIEIISDVIDLARRQFLFSATEQYQHVSIDDKNRDYCILQEHYFNRANGAIDVDGVCEIIAQALSNLLRNRTIRTFLTGRRSYLAERMLNFNVDGVTISTKLDLAMPFRDMGGLDIVDWKIASRVSNYNYQVAVYGLAALKNDTLPYFSLARRQIKGYIINLLDEDPSAALDEPYHIDDEAISRTENILYERIDQIRALRGEKSYTELDIGAFALAESDGTCALCSWQQLCLELENVRTSQSLPCLKPKTTQLELPFVGDW